MKTQIKLNKLAKTIACDIIAQARTEIKLSDELTPDTISAKAEYINIELFINVLDNIENQLYNK